MWRCAQITRFFSNTCPVLYRPVCKRAANNEVIYFKLMAVWKANSPDVSEHGREVLTRLVQTSNSLSTKPFTVPHCLTLYIMSQIWLPIRVQLGFGKFSFLIVNWTPWIVLKRSVVSLGCIIGNNITTGRALWCKCIHNYRVQVPLVFKPFHLTHSAVTSDRISEGIRFTE